MNKDKKYYLKEIKKSKEADEVITATGIIALIMGGIGSAALVASGSPDAGYVLASSLVTASALGLAKSGNLLRKKHLENKLDKALDKYELEELYNQINNGNVYEMVNAVNKLFESDAPVEEIVKNTRLNEEQLFESLQCFSEVDYEYICAFTTTEENALSMLTKHELSSYDLFVRALDKCQKERDKTGVADDRIEYFMEEINKLLSLGKQRFAFNSLQECGEKRLLVK